MLWLQEQASPQGGLKEDLIKGLAAGALGLIGSLITLAVAWFKDRDEVARRAKTLDEAIKRVAFWDGWLKAVEELDNGPEAGKFADQAKRHFVSASADVEFLYSGLQSLPVRAREIAIAQARSGVLPRWRRSLLLYVPTRRLAWIPRVAFYSGVCFFAYISVAYWFGYSSLIEEMSFHVSEAVQKHPADAKDYEDILREFRQAALPVYAGIMLIIAFITMLFRQMSVHLESLRRQ